MGIPAVVGMELLCQEAISLIAGNVFSEVALTMRILAPIVLVNACIGVFNYEVLIVNKKENSVFWCIADGAIINIAISLVLIPRFRENGTAIGSLVSEIVMFIVVVTIYVKDDKNILKIMPNIVRYIIGIVPIIIWCLFCGYKISNIYIEILFAIFGSVAIYFAILIITRDYLGEEALKAKKIVQKSLNYKGEK